MLAFLVSFLPFLFLLSSPLPLKPLPSWVNELRLVFFLFWQELIYYSFQGLKNYAEDMPSNLINMFAVRPSTARITAHVEEMQERTILDLPELALDCILEKLSPVGLCNMAGVCHALRDRCASDHLWKRHMREKWGRVFAFEANKDFSLYLPSRRVEANDKEKSLAQPEGCIGSLSHLWPLSWFKPRTDGGGNNKSPSSSSSSSSSSSLTALPVDSIMSCYLSLQSGRIWFPAQVYNRENGSVGFLLSCYDAELSYDSRTDSFYARYPPHGVRTTNIEDGVKWDRIRVSPVDTSAHDLHVSDCLNDLHPGDHIEIQWRKSKEYPYGWWYGVVGHLASCNGNKHFCHCHDNESIILEFNQYAPSSRWRLVTIDRKDHQEYGNETNGFYGGIRKLHSKDEISAWRSMWPTKTLE
ncbi:F-box domain-containing protein [Dioscorea alata]|uniref:F-box domain-containing protein n=1 Tax=Dioscorea alata TaxID=55571 RepID=A0ACB7TVT7_DIOAL|nr:F-box domain-containing protein [Dioscorea alata]